METPFMKSMTGYGSARGNCAKTTQLEVQVRSVNGRFLEVRCHLPPEYLIFENDIKKCLAKQLHRGTVDVFVQRRREGSGSAVRIQEVVLDNFMNEVKRLNKKYKLKSGVSLEGLLRLPQVLHIEDQAPLKEAEGEVLLELVNQALEVCVKERLREGKALGLVLESLLSRLEGEIHKIAQRKDQVSLSLQERYLNKIQKKAGVEIDPQRLAQEVVILVDKLDVSEELQRLKEHLQHYQTLLKSKNMEGKKLDFYTQELLREMNTIGSKSLVAEVTQSVVECKSLIEKLREQVQNIE